MPEKKKSYVKFEGIIVPSSSGEGLAETDKAWLVEIEIPNKYSGEQVWIAKSMVKPGLSIKNGDLIQGSVESWIFKKLDRKEVNNTTTAVESDFGQVEVIQPARENLMTQSRAELTPEPVVIELLKINMKMDKIIKLLEAK